LLAANYRIVIDTTDRLVLEETLTTRIALIVAITFGGWLVWFAATRPTAAVPLWMRVLLMLLGALAAVASLGALFRRGRIEVDGTRRVIRHTSGFLNCMRSTRTLPFQDIEAIALRVSCCAPRRQYQVDLTVRERPWTPVHIDISYHAASVEHLVTRLQALIGCLVLRNGTPQPPPYLSMEACYSECLA